MRFAGYMRNEKHVFSNFSKHSGVEIISCIMCLCFLLEVCIIGSFCGFCSGMCYYRLVLCFCVTMIIPSGFTLMRWECLNVYTDNYTRPVTRHCRPIVAISVTQAHSE